MIIDSRAKDTQRMIEVGPDEQWTPFLESINTLMLEEKKHRQENDSFKGAEVCCKIVSTGCSVAEILSTFALLNLVNNLALFSLYSCKQPSMRRIM